MYRLTWDGLGFLPYFNQFPSTIIDKAVRHGVSEILLSWTKTPIR